MMPSLLDQLNSLPNRIHNLQATQDSAHEADRYQTRAEQLKQWSVQLQFYAGIYNELQQENIPVGSQPYTLAGALDQIEELSQQFEQEPASILEPIAQRLSRQMDALPDEIGGSLLSGWHDYIAELLTHVPLAVLRILPDTPRYRDTVQRLLSIERTLSDMQENLPVSHEEVCGPRKLSNESTELLKTLPDDFLELPEDVRNFIDAVSRGAANVTHLTVVVVNWLHEHGLEESLSISWNRN